MWTGRADIWNLISQPFPDFEYGLEDIQLFPIPSEGQDERGAVSRDGPVDPNKGEQSQHTTPATMTVGQEYKQGHGPCSVAHSQGPCETLENPAALCLAQLSTPCELGKTSKTTETKHYPRGIFVFVA